MCGYSRQCDRYWAIGFRELGQFFKLLVRDTGQFPEIENVHSPFQA
jgi:hypothetical protein